MTDGLKPYPEYKDTGLPWLGRIPAHWDARRIRQIVDMLVSNVDKHSLSGELPVRLCNYVDVYKNERITNNLRFMQATATPDEIERFRLRAGDVLLTKDSEEWTDIGVPSLVEYTAPDLVCGYHLAILRCRSDGILGAYVLRALQCRAVAHQFHVEANGVTRYGLSHSAIKNVVLPVPPSEEQSLIVRFLDHANRRIERYIRAKRKVVALLNEQKQAIINQVVTCGLDPHVPLKDSIIPWLSQIPAHWKIRRLKHCITPIEQGWSPQCDAQPSAEDEWGVLKVGCVNKDIFNPAQNKRLPKTLRPDPALQIRDGDILVSRANTRELLGLAALAETPRPKLLLCDKLFRFRAIQECFNSKFLVLSLRSSPSRAQIESNTNGASDSMQNISQDVLKNLYVAMPPVSEQNQIISSLNVRLHHIHTSITPAEREIALIREYCTRLIADVVTGQLDVREAAARLPEESQEPEPLYADSDDTEGVEATDEPIEAEA